MNTVKFFLVTVILIAAAVISFTSYLPARFDSAAEAKVANFPKTIGEWGGVDIPIRERDYEILETKNLIMREYKNSRTGDSLYFYIIYSADNRKAVHPPEICYTGGGANTITEKSVIPVTSTIQANKFTIDTKDSRQLVVYWFKSTNLNTYNYFKQQIKIATERMLRKKTSSAMIRVSTVIKDNHQDAALGTVKSFCAEIEPLLDKYVP